MGINRDSSTYEAPWDVKRRADLKFTDQSPSVLIIGGGHSGLMLAARLKAFDVSCLVVERSGRVGDRV